MLDLGQGFDDSLAFLDTGRLILATVGQGVGSLVESVDALRQDRGPALHLWNLDRRGHARQQGGEHQVVQASDAYRAFVGEAGCGEQSMKKRQSSSIAVPVL